MIVITGPGRSGTTVVAQLYRELGFDPGGVWNPAVRAGFEAREVAHVNRRIARDLGVVVFAGRRRPPPNRRAALRKRTNEQLRKLMRQPQLDSLPRWERLGQIVERYRAELQELSQNHRVVKDPGFCWTLRVWAEAGADVEHVLVCVRTLDAMVRSRIDARHAKAGAEDVIRASLINALGFCMAAIHEHGIDHGVVRFPDFVRHPESLFETMRFPKPISREEFLEAFRRVVKEELISDWH